MFEIVKSAASFSNDRPMQGTNDNDGQKVEK